MNKAHALTAIALIAGLAGCKSEPQAQDAPEPAASEAADDGETVSILRPDVAAEQEELMEAMLEPLNAVIGFPDGGAQIDAAALIGLEAVLASDQFALDGPIVLRAHSDSAGSDRVNADAAQARGLAVAEWLIEKGVDENRIEVIVFGEQNPAEPNALPDGSPNEEGRAANRRVEILVVPPSQESGAAPASAQDAGKETSPEGSIESGD